MAAQADWREEIMQDARSAYYPKSLKELHRPLTISVKQDDSVSGSADYGFNDVKVEINSGLLNWSRLTPDALRMTICHELGHLFGGDPRKNIPMEWDGPVDENGMSYLSAEGQADYYAGLECFRKITNENVSSERIAKAGVEFLNLVREFPIAINTPDLSVTPELIRDSYPGRQCRLDTIIAGARKSLRPKCWYRP